MMSPAPRYLPPQHGAWAFLAVPLMLAVPLSDGGWVLAAFAVAWVAGYPWSYFAVQWWRSPARRRGRLQRPLLAWSAVVAPLAALLLVLRPWLVWAGLLWGASLAVNAVLARRGEERSLGNDLIQVFQSASVVPVAALLGQGAGSLVPPAPAQVPAAAWAAAAACVLWFTGATLHVKSLIRERRDPRWTWASRIYALLAVPVAGLLSPWLLVPFGYDVARSWAISPARALRPAVIGAVEIVGSVLLVTFSWAGGL